MTSITSALPETATPWLRALVGRRTRRRSWAYILALLAWLPPIAFMAGDLSFHVRPRRLPLLLIPILIVAVQLALPTLLGWTVVLVPSLLITGAMSFFVLFTAPGRMQDDLTGLAISCATAVFYVLVCVALWLARPRLVDVGVPEPSVPSNAGSAAVDRHHRAERQIGGMP